MNDSDNLITKIWGPNMWVSLHSISFRKLSCIATLLKYKTANL